MARDPHYDVLLEPLHVGPKALRNRFVQSSHCLGAGTERLHGISCRETDKDDIHRLDRSTIQA